MAESCASKLLKRLEIRFKHGDCAVISSLAVLLDATAPPTESSKQKFRLEAADFVAAISFVFGASLKEVGRAFESSKREQEEEAFPSFRGN